MASLTRVDDDESRAFALFSSFPFLSKKARVPRREEIFRATPIQGYFLHQIDDGVASHLAQVRFRVESRFNRVVFRDLGFRVWDLKSIWGFLC